MRFASLFLLLLAGVSPVLAQSPRRGQTPTEPPIVTRQTSFTIPFSVDASTPNVAVQLFLSTNRGQNWQLYETRRPPDKNFQFRAERDGEYWFASRTINDRTPAPRPDQTFPPELRVVVDTTLPELEFQAVPNATGGVLLTWRVFDLHLVPESFRLEYQADRDTWRPISIPLRQGGDRTQLAGQMPWASEQDLRQVSMRVEVRDAAGNSATIHRRVELPTIVGTSPPDNTIARREPPPGTTWPTNNQPPGPASAQLGPVQVAPPPTGTTAAITPPVPTVLTPATDPQTAPPVRPPFTEAAFPRQPSPVQPPIADRVVGKEPPPEIPEGERPRMTNTKRFRLDYDLDAIGPAGVAEVELWATKDRGRNWERWGTDEDKQSPFLVEVQTEGVFGFRVVVVGKNGLTSPTPRPGEAADIWIGVDLTKPFAQLTSAAYGDSMNAGKLDIRWDARDDRLGLRPVSLLFAETPNGPWTTIATGLQNSGQYLWTIDPRVPRAIFLRLEVRDEAGNLTVHQLTEPINTEGLSPKGRIKSFTPATDEGRSASRPTQRG